MKNVLRSVAVIGMLWTVLAAHPHTASAIPTGSACCAACESTYSQCEPTASEECYAAYLACIEPCNDPFCPT